MLHRYLLFAVVFNGMLAISVQAQPNAEMASTVGPSPGFVMPAFIDEKGDTIIMVTLREIAVTSPRYFKNSDDYRRYMQYRRYAAVVLPYALEAVKTYRQLESETRDVSNRDRKRRIKELQEQMSYQFKDPLKNLTKTQGLILIKMIERDLNMPFYDLVKDLKGGFTALYWNEFGKFYGYHLKDGYTRGEDSVLDAVLQDYDLSYYY